MKRCVTRSWRALGIVASAAALAMGCNSGTQPKRYVQGHVETENDTLATPPLLLGGPDGGGIAVNRDNRATPVLPAHIETLSQAALIDYLKLLGYEITNGGQRSNLPCTKNGVACAAAESASVYIQPEMGMDKWKHDDIPANGIIVARIIDYDTDASRTEARYGFHAQRHAWWVVDRATAAGALRSRFVERTYSSTGAAIVVLKDTAYTFRDCGHVNANVTAARAHWWGCDSAAVGVGPVGVGPVRASSAAASYFQLASHGRLERATPAPSSARMYARAEAWVTCGQGCCVADP